MLNRTFSSVTLQRFAAESGTVLLWTLGLGLMAIGVLNVSLSLVSLSAQKSELQVLADSIVLNSLNLLDFDEFLDTGRLSDVDIDVFSARAAARSRILESIDGVVISRFSVQGENLSMTLENPVELWNFLGFPFTYDLSIRSTARIEVE
jgi:hypothetical protein